MQFSLAVVAATTFALVNAVELTNTAASFVGVAAGKPLDITWTGATGPVKLTLKNGPATDLEEVSVIAEAQTGTSFTWTPASTLPEGQYAIEIEDASDVPNYSIQFPITGGTGSPAVPSSPTPYPTPAITPPVSPLPAPYSTGNATASITGTGSHPAATGNATLSRTRHSGTATGSRTSASPNPTGADNGNDNSSDTDAPNTSSASGIASPLAFVLMAFAALMTLN